MTDQTVRRLEAELTEIEKKLSELELYQDYKALERIIKRLRSRNEDGRSPSSEDPAHMSAAAGNPAAMKNAVAEVLKDRTSPLSTKEIYDLISGRGVEVPGENPTNNLSAHMSRDSRFLSWGRAGWTLTSAIDADLAEMQHIGADFVASLDDEARDALLYNMLEGNGLPSEFDGELLRFARQRMGRHLVGEEKRTLREKILEIGKSWPNEEGSEF